MASDGFEDIFMGFASGASVGAMVGFCLCSQRRIAILPFLVAPLVLFLEG